VTGNNFGLRSLAVAYRWQAEIIKKTFLERLGLDQDNSIAISPPLQDEQALSNKQQQSASGEGHSFKRLTGDAHTRKVFSLGWAKNIEEKPSRKSVVPHKHNSRGI
jgi:hypothetical protein